MTIWTNSKGIEKRSVLIETLLNDKIKHIKNVTGQVNGNDCFVGWGLKANSKKIKDKAVSQNTRFLTLEDGLIGYIGHPAKKGVAVALISDQQGIYYDARYPSDLEVFIKQPLTEPQLARIKKVRQMVVENGVTKYNIYNAIYLPDTLKRKLSQVEYEKVLIVDQVAGDLSISGAMADEHSFIRMVQQSRKNHPNASLLLRTHPDTRLGNKKGVLAKLWAAGHLGDVSDITVINDHCHPHALINAVDAVYTVSSQMGFEALLLNQPVYCFGMPFYAGWGLTVDVLSCHRRGEVSLEQLIYAALISYTQYFNPVSQTHCEIEDILQLIALQTTNKATLDKLYLVGFSLWKRAFMKQFCRHLATNLTFVSQPPSKLKKDENMVVWGAKYPELKRCIRVEDGFIRSSGLGANLCRPSSLSFDNKGIYFDSRSACDLESMLNNTTLTPSNMNRAEQLIQLIRSSGVSKYNVGKAADFEISVQDKKIILVVGQVDGDASITTGSPYIKSNEALIDAVNEANPSAYIIYKPHPDVVSGNREGIISKKCLGLCVDKLITDLPLTSLYSKIDELHTMTSLSGFEALVHQVQVHTWGQPFYAGWGLTTDYYPPNRRQKKRLLVELMYIALIKYPLYIDWHTGFWVSPELLIFKIANIKNGGINKQSFVYRNILKLKYFFEIFR